MTDNEINICIAEVCGWKCCEPRPRVKDSPFARWTRGDNLREFRNLPNYCGDLNAMQEAINTLSDAECFQWLDYLEAIINPNPDMPMKFIYLATKSTARQRAEAFLRTIGKWKE